MIKKIWNRQEFRFLLVGGLNTLVGYGLYALLLFFNINYLIANTISTIIGIGHSYLWNRFFTFKSKEKASSELIKFISVYAVSYILGTMTLFIFKSILHISPYFAGFLNLGITTLISWFGHKNFSFRKQVVKMKKENKKVLKIEWIIAIAIFVLCFLIFVYGDILITTNASITFDRLFFQNKLYYLYEASYKTFGGILQDSYITYDFPIYIFFGIWNLPLMILTKITGFYWVEHYAAIIYAKLFLVVLMIALFMIMKKIISHFDLIKEDNKMYQYLFFSSSLTIMIVAMFAGYDLLPLVFALAGIYFYLKDDIPKFTLFFTIAISIKLFALLIFIPLLLLKEKNIGKILGYLMLSVSLIFIPKIIYRNAPMYQISMNSFENNMINKLNLSYLITPFGNTSIFTTIYVLICCFCYGKRIKEKKLLDLYTMYIPLAIYGFFIIFCEVHPQWTMLFVPFLIFFLIYNKENRKTNILVEMIFSICFLYLLYQIYNWVFSPYLLSALFGKFIPQQNGITTLPILENFKMYNSLFGGAVLALLLYFLWTNLPEKLLKQTEEENWPHWLLIARSCIIIPFAAIIIYYYFR